MAEHEEPRRGRVALGVTGSVAGCKAAELTSRLVRSGVDVRVLMTGRAARLVAPATFATLSRHPVAASLRDEAGLGLEALASTTDLFVVAPATADCLAKMARGLADDPVTAFARLHRGPVLVAPSMDPHVWLHAATQANRQRLVERGVRFVEAGPGRVPGGEAGPGDLAAVEQLVEQVHVQLAAGGEAGRRLRLLVTAGPTREAIDPVRFLSNRSSGKMGYAVAGVAAAAGHAVTLVSGPSALPTPLLCRRIDVTSAAEMAQAVKAEFPACDALVMAAAVADYRPRAAAGHKLHKADGPLTIELERTEDILESVAPARRPDQRVMGFAAETDRLLANARTKLLRKRLDWVVANDVSRADIGFGADENQVVVLSPDGEERLPRMSKVDLAARLVAIIAQSLDAPR